MMEMTQTRTIAPRAPITRGSQQSRLLIALGLLLMALAAVLVKDRQFWFGTESTITDANDAQPAAASQTATQPAAPSVAPAPAAVPARSAKKQIAAAPASSQPKPADTPAVVMNRTVLPPLDVEVIAGDAHHNLHPGTTPTNLEIVKPVKAAARTAMPVAAATNVAEHQRIAEAIAPSYPALAQHMNVQGSVVLQALIASDGSIENLRVISGPAILTSAAQQAVREWRFKPVLQNGRAVETKATITVNFTIKVADSAPSTTLADSRGDDNLTVTR